MEPVSRPGGSGRPVAWCGRPVRRPSRDPRGRDDLHSLPLV